MRSLKLFFYTSIIFSFFSSVFLHADEKPYKPYSYMDTFMKQGFKKDEKPYKPYTDMGELEKTDITIQDVVSSPDEFHKKVVIVDGEISDIQYKKYINGRKFTLFHLIDGKGNKIKVYARGYINEISNGSKIRIRGRYSKHKRFLFKKLKHIMKAKVVDTVSLSSN